jgi:hypothetical protein
MSSTHFSVAAVRLARQAQEQRRSRLAPPPVVTTAATVEQSQPPSNRLPRTASVESDDSTTDLAQLIDGASLVEDPAGEFGSARGSCSDGATVGCGWPPAIEARAAEEEEEDTWSGDERVEVAGLVSDRIWGGLAPPPRLHATAARLPLLHV